MKYLLAVLIVACSSLPCVSQSSDEYRACSSGAKNQAEMTSCANQEAARADSDLNNVYRTLLAKAQPQPEAVAKIKAAERAWIGYRDAYIGAMYPAANKQAQYGSIFPMEADLLRAKLTTQQVEALKDLLRQYSN